MFNLQGQSKIEIWRFFDIQPGISSLLKGMQNNELYSAEVLPHLALVSIGWECWGCQWKVRFFSGCPRRNDTAWWPGGCGCIMRGGSPQYTDPDKGPHQLD